MLMVFKKKEVLIGALILLIGIAAFVNYSYTPVDSVNEEIVANDSNTEAGDVANLGEAQLVNADASQDSILAQARIDKENSKSESIDMLYGIINNENSTLDAKQEAESRIMIMSEITQNETTAENLIKAKGFADAIVYVSNNSVTVTVAANELTDSDIAKINEIVMSQTGINIKNIKIVEVSDD